MGDLDDIQWRNIDLNLLVAFSYLYRFESVSLAAEKSYVSQSAMSHSLSRLRKLLEDKLFVRVGHKMVATEYAHKIYPDVEQILLSISQNLLAKSQFNASTFTGVCRIGLTDYAEYIFTPAIYDQIRQQAPKAQISFINVNRSNYVAVGESEQLDIVIGSMPNPHSSFDSEHLYTEQHVCLYDRAIFPEKTQLTLSAFSEIEHAIVSPDGHLASQVDKHLKEHGFTRKVTVAARNFLTIQRLLHGRALIAIVPKRMAGITATRGELVCQEPPIQVPDFDISMLWLKHQSTDEKSMWLRAIIKQVVK